MREEKNIYFMSFLLCVLPPAEYCMVQRPHQPDQKIEEGKSRRVSDTFRDYLTDRQTINFYGK